jgi:uncharacterized delta-60 repeat protein
MPSEHRGGLAALSRLRASACCAGAACVISVVASEAAAQMTEQWAAILDGPGHSGDFGRAIAVDSHGDIYVTAGSLSAATREDYLTVKYDPDGDEVWVDTYSGPSAAYADDRPVAISVGCDDNVYVTGGSVGAGTDWDYATIKYGLSGERQWVARYDGPVSGYDYACAMAVDAEGYCYVTGTSYGKTLREDFVTVKYSPDGVEEWVARYDGPTARWDYASDVAVDALGNVYVTGESEGIPYRNDCATVKYSPDGQEQWVARFTNGEGYCKGSAIAIDADGNIFVVGTAESDATHPDYLTIKYDSEGHERWVAYYHGPAFGNNSWDRGIDVTVDADGSCYVTGQSSADFKSYDYATVKYDPSGTRLWVARYGGQFEDCPFAVRLDARGSVYVTGQVANRPQGVDQDCVTIKYDSDGTEQWVARYAGPEGWSAGARGMALDVWGNVYVCGYLMSSSSTPYDCLTLRYSDGTGVHVGDDPKGGSWLMRASPTPFRDRVWIGLGLAPGTCLTDLAVYSIRGARIKSLLDAAAESWGQRVCWDGTTESGEPTASGVYFVRAVVGGVSATTKVVLVR